jgi:hypothetical protein
MTGGLKTFAALCGLLLLLGCGALAPFQGPGETTPPRR